MQKYHVVILACTEKNGVDTCCALTFRMAMFSEELFDIFEEKDDEEEEKRMRRAKRDSAMRQKEEERIPEAKKQKLDMVSEMEMADDEVTKHGVGGDREDGTDESRPDAPGKG